MKKKPDRKLVLATLGLLAVAACALAGPLPKGAGLAHPEKNLFAEKSIQPGAS